MDVFVHWHVQPAPHKIKKFSEVEVNDCVLKEEFLPTCLASYVSLHIVTSNLSLIISMQWFKNLYPNPHFYNKIHKSPLHQISSQPEKLTHSLSTVMYLMYWWMIIWRWLWLIPLAVGWFFPTYLYWFSRLSQWSISSSNTSNFKQCELSIPRSFRIR